MVVLAAELTVVHSQVGLAGNADQERAKTGAVVYSSDCFQDRLFWLFDP